MQSKVDSTKQNASAARQNHSSSQHATSGPATDLSYGTTAIAQLQSFADQSLGTTQRMALQPLANTGAHAEKTAQLQEIATSSAGNTPPVAQRNNTGLPDNIKSGVENLSGMSLDHVNVHYNSAKPAQLGAHAYAQGSDIHVASGQEKHVAHEAWHVVQQAQGRVKPTTAVGGVGVNDNQGLEREADVMGAKAASAGTAQLKSKGNTAAAPSKSSGDVAQLYAKAGDTIKLIERPPKDPAAGFSVMINENVEKGKDVDDSVGFATIFTEAGWAGLGVTPNEFHRAHAHALSFGGAGDASNVGWWGKDCETEWTEWEQKVRGAGMAPIANWGPGSGEKGTYKVDRVKHDEVALVAKYKADLLKGIDWGFHDDRDAWKRAVYSCRALTSPLSEEVLKLFKDAKAAMRTSLNNSIEAWVKGLFGSPVLAESNFIKSMTMIYTRTDKGANAGTDRADVIKNINFALPNASEFGLKDEPENIWKAIAAANTGLFNQKNPPGKKMKKVVRASNNQLYNLVPLVDGWGQ